MERKKFSNKNFNVPTAFKFCVAKCITAVGSKYWYSIIISLVILLLGAKPVLAIPAFPGAEGFGSQSVGGRGGQVIAVTNLNDSGTGSFRAAVSASGPRIVVFQVSGIIQSNSNVYIENPYITIAGQTSPGGIAIKGSGLVARTHDVIIRGMKMRIGNGTGATPSDRDGITAWGDSTHKLNNVVIDHNSIAWAVDENTSVWDTSSNTNTITFSWNIIAEGLYCSIHVDEEATSPGCHSMGMLLESPNGLISVHHNLFSSNYDRNPAIQSGNVEFINNVVYNWGLHPTTISGGNMNATGNIYIQTAGASSWRGPSGIRIEGSPGKVYLSGNVGPGGNDWDTVISVPTSLEDTVRSNTPTFAFSGSGIKETQAQIAMEDVLKGAGALRDSVDNRILAYVQTRSKPTSSKWIINSQSEVGGWPTYSGTALIDADNDNLPDSFEQSRGSSATSLSPTALAPSGYMWIEEYANSFFTPSSTSSPSPSPSISLSLSPKPSDANGDNKVDGVDYVVWLTHFNQSVSGPASGDFNNNGTVDGVDYVVWVNNYGT